MTFQQALDFLYKSVNYEVDRQGLNKVTRQDLEEFRSFMSSLSMPQSTYPSVLIAGSNGKGSTAAFLTQILMESGYRVGLYTSPHLVSVRERIQVNREPITEEDFCAGIERIKQAAEGRKSFGYRTTFEYLTALAFLHFAEQWVDIAIVEVGLGGRLDSTNILSPLLTVLTPISLEHTHILGDTLEAIAREKAGILRRGVPLIIGPQQTQARRTIMACSRDIGAPGHPIKPVTDVTIDTRNYPCRQRFLYDRQVYVSSLVGRHQAENAATAILAAKELAKLEWKISEREIYKGIVNTQWSGRFEMFRHPSYDKVVILDGAHNSAGAFALRETLDTVFGGQPVAFIASFSHTKTPDTLLDVLWQRGDLVVAFKREGPMVLPWEKVLENLGENNYSWISCEDLDEATSVIMQSETEFACICITGSLHFVGEMIQNPQLVRVLK